MYYKNLTTILFFISYVFLVLSSPVNLENNVVNNTRKSIEIKATEDMQSVADNLKVTEIKGDYGLDLVLKNGGFDNDNELFKFISNYMGYNVTNAYVNTNGMGCSTFQTPNEKGDGYYFVRNLDFYKSDTLIMITRPDNGYSSISTINTHHITMISQNVSPDELKDLLFNHPEEDLISVPEDIKRILSIYIPVDGVNEKGLSISVNMVPLGSRPYDPNKPNLTTGLAVRTMLDKAATVDEAVNILQGSNLFPSFFFDVHFLIADASGASVTVEYVNNKINVIKTKIITNFYIANRFERNIEADPKDEEGHDRYEIIDSMMKKYPNMNYEQITDTLKQVRGVTKWSVVYDQSNLLATYYLNKNYDVEYHIKLFDEDDKEDSAIEVSVDEFTENQESDSDDETY